LIVYCKEQKTAEAAELVAEISAAAALQLDAGSSDALSDASVAAHDFKSAFASFQGYEGGKATRSYDKLAYYNDRLDR
jgi:hypothetical protein